MFAPVLAATSTYVIASFVGYLFLMLVIGAFFSGKMKNLGDYYLGGRRMNKWVVALSAQASDMSGWLLMGLPGAVYLAGFSEAWIGIGLGIGTYLNWKIVAHRLRQYSKACGDSITIPDFICNRFRDKTGASRMVAAVIILAFFLFYTASGFVAAAKLFTTMFGMSYETALWIGAAVVVSYTLLGGYMAVCWTDFIQGSLMFLAIVIVPVCVIAAAGGFSATVDQLNSVNPYLQNLFTSASTGKAMGVIGLVSCFAWGLGYFGMPHILVRFMSIDNPAEVKGSRRIAMAWVFISLGAAVVIGLVGHIFLAQHPGVKLPDDDPEQIFMVMINTIFSNGVLSMIFAGILLSAIMAAIMSTADSQLLVSASAFTNDLYKKVLHKDASNKELVLVSRLAVAAVAVVAAVICMPKHGSASGNGTIEYALSESVFGEKTLESCYKVKDGAVEVGTDGFLVRVVGEDGKDIDLFSLSKGSKVFKQPGEKAVAGERIATYSSNFYKVVMKMVSFAWGGFGAAFGPLILLALFWRRTNLAGAVSGMVVGAATCFLWKFWLAPTYAEAHPFFGIYELAPGFVLSLLTIIVISLLTKKPSQEILDEYDRVNALPEAHD